MNKKIDEVSGQEDELICNLDMGACKDERINRGLLPMSEEITLHGIFEKVEGKKKPKVLVTECTAFCDNSPIGLGHLYLTGVENLKKKYSKGDSIKIKGIAYDYKHKKQLKYHTESRAIRIIEELE